MVPTTKFNPTSATAGQVVEWIRSGDFDAAQDAARSLAIFLHALSKNPEANQILMRMGIPIVGVDMAHMISEQLLLPSKVNRKSGAELFAAVLVPGKRTKSQWLARYLAGIVYLNLPDSASGKLSKKDASKIADFLNDLIARNREAFNKGQPTDDWNPALPKKRVSVDELEKAYRKYKSEMLAADGVRQVRVR